MLDVTTLARLGPDSAAATELHSPRLAALRRGSGGRRWLEPAQSLLELALSLPCRAESLPVVGGVGRRVRVHRRADVAHGGTQPIETAHAFGRSGRHEIVQVSLENPHPRPVRGPDVPARGRALGAESVRQQLTGQPGRLRNDAGEPCLPGPPGSPAPNDHHDQRDDGGGDQQAEQPPHPRRNRRGRRGGPRCGRGRRGRRRRRGRAWRGRGRRRTGRCGHGGLAGWRRCSRGGWCRRRSRRGRRRRVGLRGHGGGTRRERRRRPRRSRRSRRGRLWRR